MNKEGFGPGRGVLALCLALVVAVATSPGVLGSGNDITDQINAAQGQYNDLQSQIDALQVQIANVQTREGALKQEIGALNQQIYLVQQQLSSQQQKLDQLQAQFDQTSQQLTQLEAQVRTRTDLLDQRLRSLYKQGEVHYLDLIVTSNNFQDLVERVLDMQTIVSADQLLVDQLHHDRDQMAQLKGQLQQQRDEQAAVVSQITAEKQVLDDKQSQLVGAEASLYESEQNLQQLRAQAEKALTEVKQQIAQLEAEAAAMGIHGSGKFIWPLQGTITQGFGCSPYAFEPYDSSCPPSAHYFHSGIDIAAAYGTAIEASDAGVAYTKSTSYGYGNYVIIIHGNGYETLYGHMSSFAVSNGVAVAKGQVIGYEGSTGNSSGPHCHFEIRYNNVPQDPMGYLP